ncbi:MAG: penicillin-binding transpeptidase domain-containing protein [Planctomycetota bacterium]
MSPRAASGIRPAAAFVGVAVVLLAVAGRSVWIQEFAHGAQPDSLVAGESPTPRFSLVDRNGVPLARSVETFDVTISPRSMWRSHTPDHMARRIAAVLTSDDASGTGVSDVLERTMPYGFVSGSVPGRLVPEDPRLLVFDADGVAAVRSWLDTGAIGERDPSGPIQGLVPVPLPAGDAGPTRWTLALDPVVTLGRDVRREQLGSKFDAEGRERVPPPETWTRRLLDDLVALVGDSELLERMTSEERAAVTIAMPIERREKLRDAVWAELVPTRFRVLARDVDPVRAHALHDLMLEEGVSSWQLQLVPRLVRRHPTRPDGMPAPPDAEGAVERPNDAFTLLGHWGVLDQARAERWARRDRDLRPHVLPWESAEDPFLAYRTSLVVESKPWSGIELLARTALENGDWADLLDGVSGRAYSYRARHLARDRRRAWKSLGGVPEYFESAGVAVDAPSVEATIDAHLQEVVHAELGLLMEQQRPALAMAIAVDVATGDVLALDARSAYAYSGFAPLLHVFTPGSTFKAIVMAIALDEGTTTPASTYETFVDQGGLRLPGRRIREAEGAPEAQWITSAEALAHSCNAVLVQIALELGAPALRERIVALGYDAAPGAGLGPERSGRVPPLERGTWKRNHTHASIGFGHEIGVTLWQHATALATVLRGGERRPLRLLRGIERDGRRAEAPLEPAVRVVGARACEEVRAMMALGAELGTGRHVATAAMNPEFELIGTKTGTTEKVATELCVHVELEALAARARDGRAWDAASRAALLGVNRPHRRSSCYTSSMCAFGRVATEDGPREVMVLVVADDPTGAERYGSRVTGPTAMAILRQAFGFSRVHDVEADDTPVAAGFDASRPSDLGSRPVLFAPRETRRASVAVDDLDTSWLGDEAPWARPASTKTANDPSEGGSR